MKTMKHQLMLLLAALLIPLLATSQRQAINMTGHTAPTFRLQVTNADGLSTVQKTNADYLGKWLLLDFWSSSCLVCITAMPKLDQLQQRFAGSIEVLLIGKTGTKYDNNIRPLYQRIAKSEKLRLAHSFDAQTFIDYSVRGVPHIVLIDPEGKVHAVTLSSEISEAKIADLLAGKAVYFEPVGGFSNGDQAPATTTQSSETAASYLGRREQFGGDAYQSQLEPVPQGKGGTGEFVLRLDSLGRFKSRPLFLPRLFMLAYLGKWNWPMTDSLYLSTLKSPTTQLADTLLSTAKDAPRFDYQLRFTNTKGTPEKLMQAMQEDLYHRFGLKGRWVSKKVASYQLVVESPKRAKKLRSRTKNPLIQSNAAGLNLRASDISNLLQQIGYYQGKLLLEDRTGIKHPIDIALQANMLKLEEVRTALKTKGLALVESEREMRVLEIYRP